MNVTQKFAARVNRVVLPLVASPRWGRAVSRWMTVITYTGRRSGRTFSLPARYRRDGGRVLIGVQMPERKSWWKNFAGDGGPILVQLDGETRPGHAVVVRDGGRISVSVTF